ncbi:MAG: AAA family ATPase [Saprospiraceae bacterium]|nr:AAA family ATPase [Saprospiraceae bacterium]
MEKRWNSGKAIIILGPRQVGKTTLLRQICSEKGAFLFLTGDDPTVVRILENADEARMRQGAPTNNRKLTT